MGIKAPSLELIHLALNELTPPIKMCEMGNQNINGGGVSLANSYISDFTILNRSSAKQYFELFGIEHTSIDLNGEDGALPVDLNLEIVELRKHYDIITDIGTGEHIKNQYMYFRNVHNLCKIGGVIVHVLPKINEWKNHCPYRYTVEFFEKLSEIYLYDIIELKTERCGAGISVMAILKKTKQINITENVFNTLPIDVEGTYIGTNNQFL